ncbi:MAG: zf-HC2 domain-containing protein [Anaerolineae bacterium]
MRLFTRHAREQEWRDELLSAYLDDQLGEEERARLEAQLAADAALQAELEALRHTVALVRDLPAVPVPRNFILPQTMTAQPRPRRPFRARRSAERSRRSPYGRVWAAPLLTAATAAVSLLFVAVLTGDLLLSGGLAYAPAAERQAEAPRLALEPSPSGRGEAEVEEVIPNATSIPTETPPPLATQAPVEMPPAGAAPTATLLSMPTEAPPRAAPEATAGEENREVATPVVEATMSAAALGRGEGEVTPTPNAVPPVVEEDLAAPTPGEAAEIAPPVVEEEGEWGASEGERTGPTLIWVTPWRMLEITLGLTALGLALATVWAWRARR